MSESESRVLIISDEPAVLRMCQQVLQHADFTIQILASVEQALAVVRQKQIDLILLDSNLSDSDDLVSFAQIRSRNPTVPIVLITGTAALKHITRATRMGAQGILLKPLSVTELRDTVDTVLQRRRSLRTHNRIAALRPLVHISQRLLAELDLPRLYDLIIETVRTELKADRASLMLRDEDEETLRIAACSGLPEEVQVGQRVDVAGSLAGWVANHGHPLLVNSQDCPIPELQNTLIDDRLTSALSVPVIVSGRVLGVLNAAKTQAYPPFTEDDQEFLVLLAGQAAIAIENARLYNLARRRADRLSMLYNLSTDVTGSLDLEQIIATTMRHVSAALGIDHGYLFLSADEPQHLVQYTTLHYGNLSALLPIDLFIRTGIIGQVLAEGLPQVVPVTAYATQQHNYQPTWEQIVPITATTAKPTKQPKHDLSPIPYPLSPTPYWLCVALISEQGICGAIELLGQPGQQFGEDDIQLMTAVATPVAMAIEKARLHASVAHSEARYRALLHHATEAVLLLDADGQRILDANPAVEQLSGYQLSLLKQIDIASLFPGLRDVVANIRAVTDSEAAVDTLAENTRPALSSTAPSGRMTAALTTPATHTTAIDLREIETLLLAKDGRSIPVSIGISRVPYDGQQILLVIARDISERKRIAQQLIQTEKLAAVGRISASIAHEINNPLQAIYNSLHLVNTRPLAEDKQQFYLSRALEEVDRLINIVQRMLDFYRPARDGVGMRPTDVHHLLDAVLIFARQQFETSQVQVVCDWSPDLPFVFAIGNHLKQVFLNLILNAIEAMPDGGTLTIRTFTIDEPNSQSIADFAAVGSATQRTLGPLVVVEFSDTGQGIAPEDLPKIFEPFYTTRSTGTGLGLAISYSIIEQHHGELSVRSTVGEGTTFRIALPMATQ